MSREGKNEKFYSRLKYRFPQTNGMGYTDGAVIQGEEALESVAFPLLPSSPSA